MSQKIDNAVTKISDEIAELVHEWTQKEAGDISQWFAVMESIVKIIQNKYGDSLTGIEKAEVATKGIVSIAQQLWSKYIDGLTEEEVEKLRNGDLKILVVIIDNPSILQASTTFFKKLLNYIDKDGDGEITQEECCMFWCCGNPNPCGKKKKGKK